MKNCFFSKDLNFGPQRAPGIILKKNLGQVALPTTGSCISEVHKVISKRPNQNFRGWWAGCAFTSHQHNIIGDRVLVPSNRALALRIRSRVKSVVVMCSYTLIGGSIFVDGNLTR